MDNITFKIPNTFDNETIRAFLQSFNVGKATIYKYSSNHQLIVNYKVVNSEYRLKTNDLLEIKLDLYTIDIEHAEGIDIIYEDSDMIIVSKPVHLIVHDDGVSKDNLTKRVNYYFQKNGYYHEVLAAHRIDKETSGLVVFAKHFVALSYLSNLFENRSVIKKYTCLVENKVLDIEATLINKLSKNKELNKMVVSSYGKEAVTHYKVLGYEATKTRLEVTIETGRTHQIRAQLAHINHPVVGDSIYGVRSSRLYLHFSEISLPMLRTKEVQIFKSNIPF